MKALIDLMGRSPCGERGLKSHGANLPNALLQSLPVRGAWIEMGFKAFYVGEVIKVAPRAGSVD